MKMADLNRLKNEKLSEIEQEEQEKAEYLQKKANQQRQEQEDEIKYLNEVCLIYDSAHDSVDIMLTSS